MPSNQKMARIDYKKAKLTTLTAYFIRKFFFLAFCATLIRSKNKTKPGRQAGKQAGWHSEIQ